MKIINHCFFFLSFIRRRCTILFVRLRFMIFKVGPFQQELKELNNFTVLIQFEQMIFTSIHIVRIESVHLKFIKIFNDASASKILR